MKLFQGDLKAHLLTSDREPMADQSTLGNSKVQHA